MEINLKESMIFKRISTREAAILLTSSDDDIRQSVYYEYESSFYPAMTECWSFDQSEDDMNAYTFFQVICVSQLLQKGDYICGNL